VNNYWFLFRPLREVNHFNDLVLGVTEDDYVVWEAGYGLDGKLVELGFDGRIYDCGALFL